MIAMTMAINTGINLVHFVDDGTLTGCSLFWKDM